MLAPLVESKSNSAYWRTEPEPAAGAALPAVSPLIEVVGLV